MWTAAQHIFLGQHLTLGQQLIFGQQLFPGEVPGEQLVNNVMQANTLQVMQLIVVLVIFALVLVIYLNGRAISQMSATQRSMSHSNERHYEVDTAKTAVMQSQVDETRRLREDFDRSQMLSHQSQEAHTRAILSHDEKTESRVQAILTHTSAITTAQTETIQHTLTDLLDETASVIKGATEAALERAGQPALEAIGELRKLAEAVHSTQQNQMDLLKRQQDNQMDLLKQQSESQMQILKTQIDRTEERLMQAIRKPDDHHTPFTPLPTPLVVTDRDPLAASPDAVAPDTHNGTGESHP